MDSIDSKVKSLWEQETQTKEKVDWTHFLSSDSVKLLRSILEKAYKHRTAYYKADDIKSAQIWSAMLEMQREIDDLRDEVNRLRPKGQQFVGRQGEEKDSTVTERILESVEPRGTDSRDATNALVESLMRF